MARRTIRPTWLQCLAKRRRFLFLKKNSPHSNNIYLLCIFGRPPLKRCAPICKLSFLFLGNFLRRSRRALDRLFDLFDELWVVFQLFTHSFPTLSQAMRLEIEPRPFFLNDPAIHAYIEQRTDMGNPLIEEDVKFCRLKWGGALVFHHFDAYARADIRCVVAVFNPRDA